MDGQGKILTGLIWVKRIPREMWLLTGAFLNSRSTIHPVLTLPLILLEDLNQILA
jgi:hypothetical protein